MRTLPFGSTRRPLCAMAALGCALAASAPGVAMADDVAVIRVVDFEAGPDTLSPLLANALAGTGHNIVNLGEIDGSAVTLSDYDRVYIIGAVTEPALHGFPASKFINYLAGGGQLVLISEYYGLDDNPGYVNEVINAVLADRVVPTVTVESRQVQGLTCAPNASWGTCAPPNTDFTPKLACGIVNGPAANMVMTMDSGAVFAGADMVGGAGALAVLMDNSWITGNAGDDPVAAAAVAATNAEAFDQMMVNAGSGGPVACGPLVTACADASDCVDGNPCTDDLCTAQGECDNPALANDTACLDGDVCNGDETCQDGACTPGTPLVIDDGDVCSADACDPATGEVTHTSPTCSADTVVLFGEVNDDEGHLIGAFSCTYTAQLVDDGAGNSVLQESVDCETDDSGDLLIGPAWCA